MKIMEKNKGLKRIISILLCWCMIFSYASPTIYAGTERIFSNPENTKNETEDVTETEDFPHIVLNQTSSNAEKNNPASDHKKEDAVKEELPSDIERATASNADTATPSNAKKVYTIDEVCEMIAELPEADELENLDEEELLLIYEAVQEAWDAFYSLTEEEQAELAAESEKLNALMAYLSEKLGAIDDKTWGSATLNYYGFRFSVFNVRNADNSNEVYDVSSVEFESAEKVNDAIKITFYFTYIKEENPKRKKIELSIESFRFNDCCAGTGTYYLEQMDRTVASGVKGSICMNHAANHIVTTDWQKTENGSHTNFCINCDKTVTQKCTYSSTTYKCTLCGGGEPAVLNSDDVYEISNPSQLIWYGEYGNGKSAKLMNNITIGSAASPYVDWNPVNTWGSFDGQGYTITAYLTHSNVGGEANGNTVGLFQVSDGAVLKNLIFKGSVNCNSTGRTGAICGSAYGSTFENIISYMDITNEADGPTGGIAGYFGQQGNAVMRNCAVYANVTGKGHTGGLVGRGWNETRYWKFYNCAYHGTVSGQEGYTGALMGYSDTKASSVKNSVISNFYYPTGMSMIGAVEASGYQESNCVAKTEEQFASGEVAYLLNSGNTSNPIWRQTCGAGLPIQTGKIVYALAGPDATLYTNDGDLIKKNADGYYEIYRTNQLVMFSDFVNVGNRSVNAVLMNDLNMNSYAWKPICSTALYYSNTYKNGDYPDAGYQGIFDGNYHTIQNLKVTSVSGVDGTYGLVGSLSGTVKNLAVKDFTYTHNSPSDMRTGVIAGQILGGTVQDCYVVNAVITPGTNVVGGIAASNYAGTVKNCHVYSSSFQGTRYGWIVGDNRADTAGDRLGTVQNCYTDGASPIASGREGSVNDGQTKTAAEFQSGKLACLLNENQSAGIWKQTLNSDEYPNFTSKDVYRHEDGVYLNAKTPTVSAGNYLIGTVEEVLGFMELVNGGTPSINGQLQADIDLKEIDMFRIGTETYPYAGTFDGNFHTLTVNLKGTSNVAPFSYAGGAVIRQLLVEGTIEASDKFAAGILAHIPTNAAETTLESCLCRVKITSTVGEGGSGADGTHGGLAGVADSALTIENCGFTGSIIGKTTYSCGGLVGWANSKVVISDSYVAGVFDLQTSHSKDNSRTFCRNDGSVTISNSYYQNVLKSGQTGTEKTQEQFESGEVTYLLNKAENGIWKQTIGKDAYPSFEGETVYQMEPCYVNYEPPEKNAEGIYEIYTDQNLMAFSQYVNQGNYAADAKVMKDLDMSDMTEAYAYVPIAWTEMSDTITTGYQGTFDGNGMSICNIKMKAPDMASANGLFGTIVSGGVVRKVIIEGFSFDDDTYDHRAGGIAGQLMQGGRIEDCAVRDSTIKASSRVVGGIAGMNLGTIQNCYTKDLSLASHTNRSGGICGDYKGGTIVNCYTSESTLGSTEKADVMGTTDDRSKAGVSAETFASGEITYKLNGDQSTIVWYQTIGSSDAPGFDGEQVYYGYADCVSEEKVYMNSSVTQGAHSYTGTPVFEWAEDYSSCTAVFSCLKDSSHEKKKVACTISTRISDDGKYYYYTATVENNEKTFTDEQKIFNAVVSVDLSWTSMDFVYGNAEWNPEDHSLGNGSWSVKENGGTIRAENKGTVWVKLDFACQSLFNGVSGIFENDELVLGYGKEGSTSFTPDGIPKERFERAQLGTITVHITRANKGALDLTGYELSDYAEAIREYLEDGTTELSLTLGTEQLKTDHVEAITEGISAAGLSTCDLTLIDVEQINPLAFRYCSWITSLSAPSAITIFNCTFEKCSNLKKVDLPNAMDVQAQAFLKCGGLTEVNLPKVKHVGLDTFRACTSLANVSLPNVTEVDVRGFYDCPNLETISLPKLQKLGDSAFEKCSKLQSVQLPSLHTLGDEYYKDGWVFANCGSLTNLTIGTAVTTFYGSEMFKNTDTAKLTLTLNSEQSDAVFGEAGTWLGYTFKEIKIYGAD